MRVIGALLLSLVLVFGCTESPLMMADESGPVEMAAKNSASCEIQVTFNFSWLFNPTLPFYWGTATHGDDTYDLAIYYLGETGKPFESGEVGKVLFWGEDIVTYGDGVVWDPVTHEVLEGTILMHEKAIGASTPNSRGHATGEIVYADPEGPFAEWQGRYDHLWAEVWTDGGMMGFGGTCNLH